MRRVVTAEDASDLLPPGLLVHLVEAYAAVDQIAGAALGDGRLQLPRIDVFGRHVVLDAADQRGHQGPDGAAHFAFVDAQSFCDVGYWNLVDEVVEVCHRSTIVRRQVSRTVSKDTPAFGKRAIRASPIAAAGVRTPYRSESLSRSRASANALSPSSTDVAL